MNYVRHSPSACNLFCASPSMFVLERVLGHRQPVGAPAHRGTAVEHGVSIGLFDQRASFDTCIMAAVDKFDRLMALSGDPRRASYGEAIPGMVRSALEELRPYGVPSKAQGFVEWQPDDLVYPIVGYYDFEWAQHGIIVDLKTTERLPTSIKPPHARQVALYAPSDNYDARLSYITPKKRATYSLENIAEHRATLHQIARRVERFMALSDDPDFYLTITAPDIESFYWAAPEARQKAFELWRI